MNKFSEVVNASASVHKVRDLIPGIRRYFIFEVNLNVSSFRPNA